MAPENIAEILEFGEARAAVDMMAAATPALVTQLGLKVTSLGSAIVLTAKNVPMTLFNRVLGLGIHEPVTESQVDEILAHFREHASSKFAFQISPVAQSPDFVHWMTARSLQFTNHWARIVRGTQALTPVETTLRVEPVELGQATTFGKVFTEGYGIPEIFGAWIAGLVGRPRWQHYMAYDGNTPIATGSLFVENGIGWLGIAATLKTHRGQGAQSAIITRRIQDGLDMGCRWLISETAEDTPTWRNPSYHNLLRFGFDLAYLRPNFEPVKIST